MNTAAIAAFQEDAGHFHMPCKDRSVVLFLKGTQRLYSKPAKPKAAMTKKILESFIRKAVGTDVRTQTLKAELHRWRAAMFEMMAYLAMARYSDLARPETADVQTRTDRLILSFNTRKNDQVHRGHEVMILATGGELCPVKLYQKYLARLSAAAEKEFHGPILPSFSKKKGIYSPTRGAASWWTIRAVQKKMLISINIDPRFFGCHSGRRTQNRTS
jgi:hypothetical protein